MKHFKINAPKMLVTTSLLLWMLVGLGFASLTTTVEAKPRRINGIAAKANGRVVTINELSFMLAPRRAELAARYPRRGPKHDYEYKMAKKKILEELIDRQLIIHEFKSIGAEIPEHVLTQKVNEHIIDNFQGDEKAFRKQLKADGLSYDKFVKLTKEKLIGQAMRSQHFNDAAPATPEEIRAEYNKHKDKLRDKMKDRIDFEKIYIPKVNNDDLLSTQESQLQLTEDIIKRIKKGESFTELAKEYSKDGFAEEGGKHNNKLRTDLSPAIGSILFTENTGTVLGPLEDSNGYHIIRVTKKMKGPAVPLEKVKDFMEREVQNRKSSARFNSFMERVRNKAIIKY